MDAETGEDLRDPDKRFVQRSDANTKCTASVTDEDKAVEFAGYRFDPSKADSLSAEVAEDGSTELILYYTSANPTYPTYTVRWMADGRDLASPVRRADVKAGDTASVTGADKGRTFDGYKFDASNSSRWAAVVAEDGSTELVLYYTADSKTEVKIPEEDPPLTEIPEEDPPLAEIPEEDPPLAEIPEEDPPLAEIPEEDPPLVEIPEEDPPLSGVPETGDISQLWAILALLTGAGLVWMALDSKKRKKDA